MRTLARGSATLALLVCAGATWATPDLDNCKYPNGLPIEPKVCELLRSVEARERAQREESAKRTERAIAESDRVKRERQVAQAERERQLEIERDADEKARNEQLARERAANAAVEAEAKARWQKEDAERAARLKQFQDEQAAYERQVAADVSARRARCGKDFGQLQVGMTLARARDCVARFARVGQVAVPGLGTVETYRAGAILLNVRDGVIVQWAKP